MSIAKVVKPGTLSFILSSTAPLGEADAHLATVAAMAADGHRRQCETTLQWVLEAGVIDRDRVRAAIFIAGAFAGSIRVETALSALAAATSEIERPSDPLSAIMSAPSSAGGAGSRRGDDGPAATADPAAWAKAGNRLFTVVHGQDAPKVGKRLDGLGPEVAAWLKADYGRALDGPGELTLRSRLIASVAALIPVEAPSALERLVRALSAHGVDGDEAWAIIDVTGRLFEEGGAIRTAQGAFERALGRRAREESDAPGGAPGDPYRWD